MKKVVYLIVDLAIIYGSILLSFYIMGLSNMLDDFQRNFDAFITITPHIGIYYLILMYTFGLYNSNLKSQGELFYTIFLISVALMIGIMGICFFVREVAFAFPRSVQLVSACFYFVFLSVWRSCLWKFTSHTHEIKKITIIGMYPKLIEILSEKYRKTYQIAHICTEDDPELAAKILEADEVFISNNLTTKNRRLILSLCIQHEKAIYFMPNYFDILIMSSTFSKVEDIPMYLISKMTLPVEEDFVKRMVDLTFGGIALILSLPITLIIACLIKLDGGPVFFLQERLTQGGRIFKIVKFRTMIPDAEKISGPILASTKDARITKVGKFIRATRIDEIPQLINIIKGDMSIVGPRPERPFFVEQFEKEIPEYRYRLKMKAGLTGLAQIEGKYNTSVEDKLRYDLIYINNYSILSDFLIMLRTVKIIFLKESTEGVNSN
ncbi:MAG: sugar transferase [Dysgonamonadaceae bacterium]|jgi:exopolysaccharide biosynthesis polyprenyl glycosylphosphotransferase|nr:sugar transferase [Dysgonamonadaceae bacterium]